MKFYYANNIGDNGYFHEDDLVKAIYTAWNIEAILMLVDTEDCKETIFSPYDDNEYNSNLLEPYGYKMKDIGKWREIIDIKTGKVIRCDFSEVKQLV